VRISVCIEMRNECWNAGGVKVAQMALPNCLRRGPGNSHLISDGSPAQFRLRYKTEPLVIPGVLSF
jgi:hypothetical protein